MTSFVSTIDLHRNLKKITDQVMKGSTIIVLKHSKPAFKISPLEIAQQTTYSKQDVLNFSFSSTSDKDLSLTYKQYIY